ncbi:MAG: serine/threonine-protein kinase [bacterium]
MKDTFANFEAKFADLGLDEKTLQIGHDKTIVPQNQSYRSTREVMNSLPRMSVDGDSGLGGDLKIKGKIGAGGMGMVRLAEQAPLDRLVAVKSPLAGREEGAVNSLLQEAYITGMVEHPNVVPIYTLGRSESGEPLIVMKRIEGVAWQDVLNDPSRAPTADAVDLHWHLRILIEVCDAVRYAHNRGVIHRDIKPENVMIGQYGEVYLLDWGIAVSLNRSENPMLRHVSEATGVAGTPSYMAPEMTDDTAINVDVRTDVYLLGAVLHEIITGTTRHEGESLMKVFFAALQSEPVEYGPDVPRELGNIANKATSKEREDRYQTVAEFQQAILDYIEHRASIELSEAADDQWSRLSELLSLERDPAQELELHDLFGECRFGYRQALRLWGDNVPARDGLQRCLQALIEYYIESKNDVGAAATLKELPTPVPELNDRVTKLAELRALEEREMAKLRRFSAANDLAKGSTARSVVAIVLGLFWGYSNLSSQWALNAGEIPDPMLDHVTSTGRTVSIAVLMMVIFRKALFSNAANRRIMFVMIAALFAVTCARVGAYWVGADLVSSQAAEMFLWAFSASMIGIVTDLRIAFASVVFYAAGFLGIYFQDGGQLYPMAIASFLFFAYMAFLWRKPRTLKAS